MLLPRSHGAVFAVLALSAGACTCSGPKLTSISPKAARAGGAAFTLTVTGQEMGSGTKVVWGDPNGKVLETTRVDRGHLTAKVSAEDIATPGVIKVHLRDSDATGSADFTVASAAEVPVARICADVLARVGAAVQLDGSCSTSPTGAALTYAWVFTRVPDGSKAALDDPSSAAPTFTADQAGDYELQLVVSAGDLASDPATGRASTSRAAPVANAGKDRLVSVGASVALDGARSTDVSGGPLTYTWTFASRPDGSEAQLSDPHDVRPHFSADKAGTYELELVVANAFLPSAPSRVRISTAALPPVADAGKPQGVAPGASVQLDGSASSSPSGTPLTFRWALIGAPAASKAALSDPSTVRPNFTADESGTYVAQLIVNDGTSASAPTTVRITTGAARPVANPGADQTASLNATVALDGSLSSAASGRSLAYHWSLLFRPPGSQAALAASGTATPTFAVDKEGTYVAQLIVDDGVLDSLPATVVVATGNSPPVANAGAAQEVELGATVTLDGSASSDVDGDPLTYHWTLSAVPEGSSAALSDPSVAKPTFAADRAGTYVAQLVVNDGKADSAAASVTVAVAPNHPPVAAAGPDQSVPFGSTVQLDGSGSSDPEGAPLTYRWRLSTVPEGSGAALSDPSASKPTFTADRAGTYIAQLVVNDGKADSAAASVTITVAPNHPPVAQIGADQSLPAGSTVQLDGSGSSDPDGDSLTYRWSLTAKPASSQAALSDVAAAKPTFVADQVGTYSVQLVVNDGKVDSSAATGTVTATPKGIVLALIATRVVGVSRPAKASATLSLPAPAGGASVSIASSDTSVLAVDAPSTITIPEGQTTGEVTLNGIAPGKATLTAAASGYVDGKLDVTVTLNLISVPVTLNVALGQTTAFPVTIAPNPAPAGGVVVTLTSSNPSAVGLVDAAVTIPQGAYSANTTVRGVAIGTSTINASNPNYAAGNSQVTTTAAFAFSPASTTIYKGLPPYGVTLALQVAGTAVPAPAGGVDLALSAADPSCLSATAPAIAAGATNTIVRLDYGGSAKLPCTTKLTATSPGAPGIAAGSINVTVRPQAQITFSNLPHTVGAGLMFGSAAYLNASNHGGVMLHIASSNPARVLLAKDTASAGAASLDLRVPDGQSAASFAVLALEDQSNVPLAVPIAASAPGFLDGTASATVVKPGLDLYAPGTTTTFAANSSLYARCGIPSADLAYLAELQSMRFGGPGATVTMTTDAPTVAVLLSKTDQGASQTTTIAPQQYYSPTPAANGGIDLKPLLPGTVHLQASAPGFVATTAASKAVAISAPNITWSNLPVTVGAGLQSTNHAVYLGATNHGGTTIHLASSNPQAVLLAKDGNSTGAASIDLPVAAGGSASGFSIIGLETAPSLPAASTITATCPGFNSATGTATVAQAAYDLSGVPNTTTTFSPPNSLYVRVGVPTSDHSYMSVYQPVRQGASALTATLSTSDAGVAKIGTSAAAGPSGQVAIAPGQYQSPGALAQGGATLVPAGGGTATITASIPGLIATTSANNGASHSTTVSAPTFSFSSLPHTIGIGLEVTNMAVYLSAGNHGGVTVHVESADPSRLLLAPNSTATPTGSLDVPVANGGTSLGLAAAAVEGSAPGVVNITVSAPGFTSATTSATLVTAGYDLYNVPRTATTLSSPVPIEVRVGVPGPNNAYLNELQMVRVGGAPLTATVRNSVANVAQLLSSAPAGQTASATLAVGQYQTPTSLASGGIAIQKLTAGTTTLTASIPGLTAMASASQALSVSTPGITYSSPVTQLGAGLQTCCWTAILGADQHGGVTVHVASSDPTKLLITPNATSPGAASLDIPVANGATTASFGLMALESASPLPSTVAITSSAQGFTDGTTTATVVQPAVDLYSVPSSIAATAANAIFYARVGTPDSSKSYLTSLQAVRIGGSPLTATVTNSSSTAAQLATPSGTGQTASLSIAPGSYQTGNKAQGGFELDPLAAGSTTVSVSIPGFVTLPTSQANVTVTP